VTISLPQGETTRKKIKPQSKKRPPMREKNGIEYDSSRSQLLANNDTSLATNGLTNVLQRRSGFEFENWGVDRRAKSWLDGSCTARSLERGGI
jgi:hypothetical protein